MKQVWKYPLQPTHDIQEIELPAGSAIVHVGEQAGNICVWAEVGQKEPDKKETRKFRIVGTGWDIEAEWKYVSTAIMGSFVWHVYEVIG